jgi:sporulation protein YlmC with PRC-barrel domain
MNATATKRILGVALGAALALPITAMGAQQSAISHGTTRVGDSVPIRAADEVRLSKLIGMPVRDGGGENLGRIEDIVLNSNTGRLHYAILARGGVANIGDELFAVSLSQARPDGKGALILGVDKHQLEAAPNFNSRHWPNWNDETDRAEVDQRHAASAARANARFRRASELMKVKVRDSHGAMVGTVDDMVVDLADGNVAYVVVKFDRAWSPNDKLVAVSMRNFADGAVFSRHAPDAHAAGAPRNPPPVQAFEGPAEPTRGTASAVIPPGGIETRPPALDPAQGAKARPIEREPLDTTTSYADDEGLVFKGSREELASAPPFDPDRYPAQ